MKKLPQVFLVLTVLALGVMYGYYDFRVERGYGGSFLTCIGETFSQARKQPEVGLCPVHRAMLERDKATKTSAKASGDASEAKHPEAEKAPEEGAHAERTPKPETREPDTPKPGIFPSRDRLDKADQVLKAASAYYKLAVMNVEKRQEYAQKILDSTEDTLETLDELNQKFPNQPEIEERLSEILRLRQFATKELGAGQPDGKNR